MSLEAIILAAGKGTRMRSSLPKVLHPIAGQPMILHAINTVQSLVDHPPVLVVGHEASLVQQVVGDRARYVLQEKRLGTGHAVMQAEKILRGASDHVLVITGDMPLLTKDTLRYITEIHATHGGPITMLTIIDEDPRGFGRIIRNANDQVLEIVEEVVATPAQLAIRELNAGVYCYSSSWLWDALHRIQISPKGEYYLTDLVGIANQEGLPVAAVVASDPLEAIGINTRTHLSEAEKVLRARINRSWMDRGVTMIDPDTVYIDMDVILAPDTVIYPNTILNGASDIGKECQLGPNTVIDNALIKDHCIVTFSVIENAIIENGTKIGPFEHIGKNRVKKKFPDNSIEKLLR